jgi:hypothetical protein
VQQHARQAQPTPAVYEARNVVDVWKDWGIARRRQFGDGKVKGILETLLDDVFVFVWILGHNAHQQLVQRVLDALAVEGRHDDAPPGELR